MKKNSKGKIIILSGPSGSGKTTIHNNILSSRRLKGKIVRSVSATTRNRRSSEKDGREYFFLSPKMFAYKKRAGHFLEWARVFGCYYGTPAKHVKDLLASGKSVLLCIDVQGAKKVMKKRPRAKTVFVRPPSLAELEQRLFKRGTESAKDFRIRLKTARQEMRQAKNYDCIVVNDNLKQACREVEDFIARQIDSLV